jgi:hypothetical protein
LAEVAAEEAARGTREKKVGAKAAEGADKGSPATGMIEDSARVDEKTGKDGDEGEQSAKGVEGGESASGVTAGAWRGARNKEEAMELAGDVWRGTKEETSAARARGGTGKSAEDSCAAANTGGGENTKDRAADKPRGSTGERRTVVSPDDMVAAPAGGAKQSGEDAIAGGGRPERPEETSEASSFERRRSLPAKSNEFIVLHTRNKRDNNLLKENAAQHS